MQRRRLELIKDEAIRCLAETEPSAQLVEVAYRWRETWYRLSGQPIDDRLVLSHIEETTSDPTGWWRGTRDQTCHFYLEAVDAVAIVSTPAPIRTPKTERILAALKIAVTRGQASYDARHDELTGLWNRRAFDDAVKAALERQSKPPVSGTTSGASTLSDVVCLVSADVDHFKQVNDSFGHQYGDLVLHCFARRMQELAERTASKYGVLMKCARPGGEEFAILCEGQLSRARLEEFARLLSAADGRLLPGDDDWGDLAYQFGCGEMALPEPGARRVTASVGISSLMKTPPDSTQKSTHDALMRQADQAVYRAKRGGRSTFRFFDDIRARYGSVIERHSETSLICIDIGRSVDVAKGDEYLVYHPDFSGEQAMILTDGRSSRVLGLRPRVQSGRIEVFEVQDEIAFARIVGEAPSGVVQAACLLEYVPVGAIGHLSRGYEAGGDTEKQLRTALQEAYNQNKIAFVVVATLVDGPALKERLGTTRVNDALAQMQEALELLEGVHVSVVRLDTWGYGALVDAGNIPEPLQILKQVLAVSKQRIDARIRIAIGAAEAPKSWIESTRGNTARLGDTIEKARLAVELSKRLHGAPTLFDDSTGKSLLYDYRQNREHAGAFDLYATLATFGAPGPEAENQVGLCYLESTLPDFAAAERHFRAALAADPAQTLGVYHANLGLALYEGGQKQEAAESFERALSGGFKPYAPYYLPFGAAFAERSRSLTTSPEEIEKALHYLKEAQADTNVSLGHKQLAAQLVERLAGATSSEPR
ncbi:MAG TPA: diguanylate cyclase [Nannocystaceae bacterium]|nr:diguanylate cyclase [Nannocystaceae bacterium]